MMDYTLIRSHRKTIALYIRPEGTLEVRAPQRMSKAEIQRFVESKRGWIEKHLDKMEARPQLPPFTEQELHEMAEQAAKGLPERIARFAPLVGVSYGRATVRPMRSRWGSCSSDGNLSFNCLLSLCPAEVADYVVVHELCHRKEMNHSPRFWAEVARILPDYGRQRKWLKENGAALIQRLQA